MNQIAVQQAAPRSVLIDMSNRYGMEPAAFEATLRATVVPGNCTREQFAAFLLVAKEYKLNPLLKEIYAFPSKGGIQPIVGVDGWANLINCHPAFDGMDFEDHFDDKGDLFSITCKMHRKDRSHPITATEYLSECKRPTEPWQKWPRRMLRHKSMIQAARYAFSFAGIVDPDEADRYAGEFAQDVTPRAQIVPISQRIANQQTGGASTQTDLREQESTPTTGAETVTTSVETAQVDQEGETPSTESNSSDLPQDQTDTPAADASSLPPAAGTPSELPADGIASGNVEAQDGGSGGHAVLQPTDEPSTLAVDWQETYLKAMQRVNDRPRSLPSRHAEAIQLIGGKANASEQDWMKAVYRLTERRLKGEITPDDFTAAVREIS